MTIQDRYRQLIDFYTDGNMRKFSKKINVTPSVITNITGSRQSNPSFEVLAKTLSAFVNINARWLILGEGEMEGKTTKKGENALEISEATKVEDRVASYITIKDALNMIRDLAGENAVLKHKLESEEQDTKVTPDINNSSTDSN